MEKFEIFVHQNQKKNLTLTASRPDSPAVHDAAPDDGSAVAAAMVAALCAVFELAGSSAAT